MIEHTICRLKKYRIIIEEVFRNRLRKYNRVSDIVSGLVNYRIMNHLLNSFGNCYVDMTCFSNYARDLL